MSNDPITLGNSSEEVAAMTSGTSFFLIALTRSLIKGGQLNPETLQEQVDLVLKSTQPQINTSLHEKTAIVVKTLIKESRTNVENN